MNVTFPSISIGSSASVNPTQYIERGTGLAMCGAVFAAIIGTLLGIVVSYGVLLVVILFYPLIAWYLQKQAMALIHGSGVHVSERQFPEIHRCVQSFKDRLGLSKEVEVYIVEDNVTNAFAVKHGKKNVILLTDDLIHGCVASGQPQALSFVIAHELAHIALNHNSLFLSWMSQHMKKLSRLNEYSADAVATALVADKNLAFQGLLLLTVGYALLPYVNSESIVQQAQEVAANKYSKKAEIRSTHPLLLNRLNRILARA